jgi:hypothetical protein
MDAPIQRLWHRISRLPFLSFLHGREPVPELPEDPYKVALDKVAVTFKQCEDDCAPSAKEIDVKEHERAEQLKRDVLVPVMGIAGVTGITGPPV